MAPRRLPAERQQGCRGRVRHGCITTTTVCIVAVWFPRARFAEGFRQAGSPTRPGSAVASAASAVAPSRAEGIASLQGRAAASRAWCKGRSLPCTAMEAGGGYEHPEGRALDGLAEVRPRVALMSRSRSPRGTFRAHWWLIPLNRLHPVYPPCQHVAHRDRLPRVSRVTRTGRPSREHAEETCVVPRRAPARQR